MLHIRKTGRPLRIRFGEHSRAVVADDSSHSFARYFNSGRLVFPDMKFRVTIDAKDKICVSYTNLELYTI